MNQLFLLTADYLKGKPIYEPIRRILNLLFNVSIASFFYEKVYGHYEWLNIYDYKGILNFFIKGHFFIPFSIYIIVFGITYFFAFTFFILLNHFKSVKYTREIISYEVSTETMEEGFDAISLVSNKALPVDLDKQMLIDLYGEFRKALVPDDFKKIDNELKAPKTNLEKIFRLCFRAIVAITIYFLSLPQFGWILFSLAILILLVAMYVILLAYRFLDMLPTLVRKFYSIAENYFSQYQKRVQ